MSNTILKTSQTIYKLVLILVHKLRVIIFKLYVSYIKKNKSTTKT